MDNTNSSNYNNINGQSDDMQGYNGTSQGYDAENDDQMSLVGDPDTGATSNYSRYDDDMDVGDL